MPRTHSRTKKQKNKKERKRRGTPQVTEIASNTSTTEVTDDLCDLPLSQPKDSFPWSCLPRELQIKILQKLDRSDLDICLLVNREISELIQCNGQRLNRRLINLVMISRRCALYVKCFKEKINHEWVFRKIRPRRYEPIRRSNGPIVVQHHFTTFNSFLHYHLGKKLRNADINEFNISSMPLTCEFLSTIRSCIEDAGCRVNELTIEKTSTTCQISDVLLRFFRTIAPVKIRIDDGYRSFLNTVTPEGLEFIVTRRSFSISALHLTCIIPIDDDILAKLTANRFWIGAPNMITSNGIRTFLQRVMSGELLVTSGGIYTHLYLDDIPFPLFISTNTVIILTSFDWGDGLNHIEIIPVEEAEAMRRI